MVRASIALQAGTLREEMQDMAKQTRTSPKRRPTPPEGFDERGKLPPVRQ
jgi:hypothetical protein